MKRETEDQDTAAAGFVIGTARAGTSMLYKALCLHPDVAYISNWVARWPDRPWLARLNRAAPRFPKMQRQVWFGGGSNAYVYGSRRKLAQRLFPMPHEGEPLYRQSGVPQYAGEPAASTDEQIHNLRRAFTAIQRHAGGSCLISKRISNNRRIPLLLQAFPRARFVEIVRDGRAVAYSLSKVDWWETSPVWWYGGTPRDWRSEGRDPWEICARNWVEELREIETGLGSVPPGQVFRVRYESFVQQPVETLEGVASFLGLASNRRWRHALDELQFPNKNEAWRAELDDGTVATITAVQSETLRSHGYLG